MATGEVPFAGESTWQVMYRRVKEKPKDPKLGHPDLPDWVLQCDFALPGKRRREPLSDRAGNSD